MPQQYDPILAPVVALVLWTLVMFGWLVVTRGAAVRAKRINIMASVGGRGQDLEGVIPREATWPAHNYTHLHEQPTIFYAVALATAMMGAGGGWGVTLAWIYVAARVAHSVWQATVNRVSIRFLLFAVATTALGTLALRTALIMLGAL